MQRPFGSASGSAYENPISGDAIFQYLKSYLTSFKAQLPLIQLKELHYSHAKYALVEASICSKRRYCCVGASLGSGTTESRVIMQEL
jgi:hypothetical protein